MPSIKISFHGEKIFYELDFLAEETELVRAVQACIEAQKKAALPLFNNIFVPSAQAARKVSPEALDEILKSEKAINGIRTERDISNVIVFNDKRYEHAVFSEEISAARKNLDILMRGRLAGLFGEKGRLDIHSSGFFLYPPQGYMGWHTNWQNPGWRLYINYAEEPGKSFFRYRDPETGGIVTSIDKQLNFRLFRATRENPFWHAVYSETNRYSLGYKIARPQSFVSRLKSRLFHSIFR